MIYHVNQYIESLIMVVLNENKDFNPLWYKKYSAKIMLKCQYPYRQLFYNRQL